MYKATFEINRTWDFKELSGPNSFCRRPRGTLSKENETPYLSEALDRIVEWSAGSNFRGAKVYRHVMREVDEPKDDRHVWRVIYLDIYFQ